ncbi:guanine nucleotide-binding protein subunit beta 1 [Reticulomyxa filosa]|uniref:Guanine nucleotide-binding protein subunit beta 1 n=1 Tax=Reticulomyxa filosa TaxID=46433 RepID=X6P8B0_RETFI|nr:guanine nucleotide-binding protein subunit beta 1 [Reticulomyxa filosa]|eukprot:ETO34353.1 guanine nucleotide-binding protein subunit beta 1 [Reticulomyxa filosa]
MPTFVKSDIQKLLHIHNFESVNVICGFRNLWFGPIQLKVLFSTELSLLITHHLKASLNVATLKTSNILKNYSISEQFKGSDKNNLKAKELLKGHFGRVRDIDWRKDGKYLLSASQDGKLLIWDASTATKKGIIPLRSSHTMSCAFSPSGNIVASGGLDNTCSIFDVSDTHTNLAFKDRLKHELIGHEGYLSCCKFIDENTIITASGDSSARCWDIEKELMVNAFLGHTDDIMSVCIDQSSHLCITGSVDATAKVWDHRASTRCILNFWGYHKNDINCVRFFPNKRSFVTASDDASCRLFDLRAYKQMAIYQYDSQNAFCVVDVSSSGYYIFGGYEEPNFVMAWNTITTEQAYQLQHPTRVPYNPYFLKLLHKDLHWIVSLSIFVKSCFQIIKIIDAVILDQQFAFFGNLSKVVFVTICAFFFRFLF